MDIFYKYFELLGSHYVQTYQKIKFENFYCCITSKLFIIHRKNYQENTSTVETRLSGRSIVPLTPTIEKPGNESTNYDDTAVTTVDLTDQSNASP